MDTITPTPELLRKGGHWERPSTDQKTNRVAYRKLSVFESLHQQGKISDGAKLASDKLTRHLIGATGANVGSGDGGTDTSDMVEVPSIWHGQKVAEMRRVVANADQWSALVDIALEVRDIEAVGRGWMGCKQRGQAYIAGLSLIRLGLERLAQHYGMDVSYHARASP